MDFRILGPVEALAEGGPVALGRPKQRAVLAALLLRAGEGVPRDRLIDAVWGEDPPVSAVGSLQVYVSGLRKALGSDRIETHGASYRARLEPGELDLDRFEALVARAERAAPAEAAGLLGDALALWRGPPLADLTGEPLAETECGRLEERRLHALELRIDTELALGRHEAVVGELESLVADHPYRESLRRLLALALYRSGRQAEALEAHRRARASLDELGIEPSPELRALEQAILRQDPELAAPVPEERVIRLPAAPTPLIGRRLEVAAVAGLLREDARLVTLTGPGGAGKTRLALAVAEELASERSAVFVDLSALADPELVEPTITQALGEIDEIGSRSFLLVLDNFEQLLDAATHVADLLAGAPGLRVLATSRAPLRLSAEHEYPVQPLPLADAVQLFAARARAVDPAFSVTDDVAEICKRLDSLPLALELAAARSKVLPPAAMVGRLERSLELLTGGARDLPPRQQTLEATLDWSYELLDPAARSLFAQLAVFRGGCTLVAAEAVAGRDVLGEVGALVDENLVRRSGERYAMLETIREYAARRLGGDEDVRRRHAEYFLGVAKSAGEGLATGTISDEELARLDAEHDNLRVAIEWVAGSGEIETEIGLVVALRQFWLMRGLLSEGRRAFEGAVERAAGADPALRALVNINAGLFPYRQGDLETANGYWTTALELYRELGDAAGEGRALAELGAVAIGENDLDRALELYEAAVAHFREHETTVRLAVALSNLGALASMRGDYDGAARHYEEAIPLQLENGDRDGLAISLHNLGRTEFKRGRFARSGELIGEALESGRTLGYKELIAYCLQGCAELAARSDPERAARLCGASLAILEEIGVPLAGEDEQDYLALQAVIAETLDPARIAALEAEGREAPLDEVVVEGLEASRSAA